MIIYRIQYKQPEVDTEVNVMTFSGHTEAEKEYKKLVNALEIQYENDTVFEYSISFERVELRTNLSAKKLLMAVMSGRGYAKSIVTLATQIS